MDIISYSKAKKVENRLEEIESDLKKLEILPVTNLIKNGNFSNGTESWSAVHGSISAENNELLFTATSATSAARIQAEYLIPIPNHKYYVSAEILPTYQINTGRFQVGDDSSVFWFYNLPANKQTKVSGIIEAFKDTTYFRIYTTTYNIGEQVKFKNIIVADLTETFGVGNEPTVEEFETMLSKFPNLWFDGRELLVSTKDIYDKQNQLEQKVIELENSIAEIPSEPIIKEKPYYFIPQNVPNWYKPTQTMSRIQTVEEYQSLWDGLVNLYPDYITKTHRGKDASGLYDIYDYHLKNPTVEARDIERKRPKIIIVSGLHGGEVMSIHSVYYAVKELCEAWSNNDALDYIKHGVEIVVNPLANPWAFNHGDRVNFNGVDLNRNFETNWKFAGEGTSTFGGTAPFSEVESQYVRDMIAEHPDAFFAIDYHTNNSSGNDWNSLMWHSLLSNQYRVKGLEEVSTYHIEKMTREMSKTYSLPNDVGYYGYISYSNLNGSCKLYMFSQGIDAMTLECWRKFPSETELYSPNTIQGCTEYLITFLLLILNHYKNR